MKRKIKTFESFTYPEQFRKNENDSWHESSETCNNCGCDCNECECDNCDCTGDWKDYEESPAMMERKKSTSYKNSGLKHPEKADLNKDKKISGYEKTRGKAIQKSMEKKDKEEPKGLTAKQKKLPAALRAAIEKRMKKK